MNENSRRILSWIDSSQDDIISFARQLVSIPSVNPPGGETEVAQAIHSKLRELGLGSSRTIAKEEHRPNLILTFPQGITRGACLLFNGHMDTKPVGARDEWLTDPFDPVIVDGRLYGLGSTDMKGGLAAMVFAAEVLEQD